ncbi:hypothetical protein BC826DRAFT_466476 [Russula brevipes]|nr:hypothetical protein BC826DRAFT_466476 [Russula brevipes]
MLSIPYITWSTAAAIIALICYCGVPLVCQVYSISACVLSRIHLPSPPGYVDPMMPSAVNSVFSVRLYFRHSNALMFVLMTNCISRNRDA